MKPKADSVAIVCHPNDVHAEIVAAFLSKKFALNVEIIDTASATNLISLRPGHKSEDTPVPYNVIWVRRKRFLSVDPESTLDLDIQVNISQSNEDAIHEFLSENSQICINPPESIIRIENKATQLRLATEAGLRVPHTLISGSYDRIKEFAGSHSALVIKNLRPQAGGPTGTFEFKEKLLNRSNCAKSFAIYQEKINGHNHFRILVLSNDIYAFRYRSKKLDSRFDARNEAELIMVDSHIRSALLRFMEISNLRMGVFDFKESTNGEWFFLEINQQGAFAYLDPLSNFPLLSVFSNFLYAQGCQNKQLGAYGILKDEF